MPHRVLENKPVQRPYVLMTPFLDARDTPCRQANLYALGGTACGTKLRSIHVRVRFVCGMLTLDLPAWDALRPWMRGSSSDRCAAASPELMGSLVDQRRRRSPSVRFYGIILTVGRIVRNLGRFKGGVMTQSRINIVKVAIDIIIARPGSGRVDRAAEMIGVSSPTLYRWMRASNMRAARGLDLLRVHDLSGIPLELLLEADGPVWDAGRAVRPSG